MAQPGESRRRDDLLLIGLAVLLVMLTVLSLALPLSFAVDAPLAKILLNQLAAVVALAAAWLSWLRYRNLGEAAAIYQTSAFVLFALSAGVQLCTSLGFGRDELRLGLDQPGQAPLYAWAFHRIVAAALLLRAGMLYLEPPSSSRRPVLVILLPLLVVVAASLAAYGAEAILPPLLGAEAIARLQVIGEVAGVLPGITPLELLLQSTAVVLFAAAALAYARAARRRGSGALRWLAAGLTLAAVAQIHFAAFPGVFGSLLTTSDVLRVLFYACVVLGAQSEVGATLRELRSANRELVELRDAEVARASLAERARLAREVHDGLAQNIWLARLAAERLGRADTLEEVGPIREELEQLLEAGMAEAQQTVLALRDTGRPDAPFADALSHFVTRFAQRTGLSVRVHTTGLEAAGGAIPPRVGAELLRIAQEALN
ncbi:MAG TPA: histidine kinase, partial [Candidatus Limnocylindria bacterium]|nr:histidine kinase [Candidatus Limnocylindria bacterium]